MIVEGHLDKMITSLEEVVKYTLPVDNHLIELNPLLGKEIRISFSGKIHCMNCGKQTKSSFGQGYCFQCFNTIPETDECILHPEKCKAHLGISRDIEWSKTHCLTEHIVYLAFTGNLKVGVTRLSQIPTRWIDQGASQAIRLANTPNRHIAGLIEVFFKQHISDKTSYQQMLKSDGTTTINLRDEKRKAIELLPSGLHQFIHQDDSITTINFPIIQIPREISSTNLNKEQFVIGVLTGIKGQYLILNNASVINIRTHRGYLVSIEY